MSIAYNYGICDVKVKMIYLLFIDKKTNEQKNSIQHNS